MSVSFNITGFSQALKFPTDHLNIFSFIINWQVELEKVKKRRLEREKEREVRDQETVCISCSFLQLLIYAFLVP